MEYDAKPKCLNCNHEKPETDAFCRHCGQKHTRLSDGLGYFVADLCTSFFSVDGRAFKTLWALFVYPGKVAEDFLQGRRVRYISSAQLYLVSGFLFFLALGNWIEVPEINNISDEFWASARELDEIESLGDDSQRVTAEKAVGDAGMVDLDKIGPSGELRNVDLSKRATGAGTESRSGAGETDKSSNLVNRRSDRVFFDAATRADMYYQVHEVTVGNQRIWISFSQFRDFATQSDSAIRGFFADQGLELSERTVEIIRNCAVLTTDFGMSRFVGSIVAVVSQVALLMLPTLALMLRILFWRSSRSWLSVFIVSAHLHAAIYLLLALLLTFGVTVDWLFLIAIPLLIYFSLGTFRRVFRESWFWTIFKASLVAILYLGCLSFIIPVSLFLAILTL